MPTRHALLALALLAATAACSARRIPGSEIRDTDENRDVLAVIGEYGQSMERRDAAAVLALVAPDYFDGAGTPDPADDLDRAKLEQTLPQDLSSLEALRLELSVRRLDVKGDDASAEVFFDGYYRVKTPAGAIPRRESDLHRLVLKRVGPDWKIVSGL
jgi:hypothetical protein